MSYLYFTDQELKGLDPALCKMLDLARGDAGVPFTITSGLRTPKQNDSLDSSVKDSAHLTGHAVDLVCEASDDRYKMIVALLFYGFKRIGIYAAHIHADNDLTKPQGVIWYVAAN